MSQKTISILTPCYNEEANVLNLYNQVRAVMAGIGRYEYEHIFIDNHSRDNTVAILRLIAAEDPNVKIIANARSTTRPPNASAPSRPSKTTPASVFTIARSSNSSASSTTPTPTSAA